MSKYKNSLFFSLNDKFSLSKKIADNLEVELSPIKITSFADGEFFCQPLVSVRGKQIFIIQSLCHPVNENLMKLFIAIDAFKRAASSEINIVIPYFAYARQDRKTEGRTPISAKLISDLLMTSGSDRIILVELHSEQIQGFFNIPIDQLKTVYTIAQYIKKINIPNLVVVAPDFGAVKKAKRLSELLKTQMAIIYKKRNAFNAAESIHLFGDIKEKNCLILDDIIDTGGTIIGASKLLKSFGAKKVYVCATHGLFSGSAYEKFEEAWKSKLIEKVYITDSIPTKNLDFLEVISISKFLSEIIKIYLNKQGSVSALYKTYSENI